MPELHLLKNKRNESTVDYVRGLLARCESGEVVAVTVLTETSDGMFAVGGSSVSSRLATAGALLDAAMTRLQAD